MLIPNRPTPEEALKAALIANEAAGLPAPSEFAMELMSLVIDGTINDEEYVTLIKLHYLERQQLILKLAEEIAEQDKDLLDALKDTELS